MIYIKLWFTEFALYAKPAILHTHVGCSIYVQTTDRATFIYSKF